MNKSRHILGIDTASAPPLVTILRDEKQEAITSPDAASSSSLAAMIEGGVRSEKIVFGELISVVVDVGPGSFTGLRAGIAFAKGIYAARRIPLISVSKFERAIAMGVDFDALAIFLKADTLFVWSRWVAMAGNFQGACLNHATGVVISAPVEAAERAILEELPSGARIGLIASAANATALNLPSEWPITQLTLTPESLIQAGLLKSPTSGEAEIADIEPLYVQPSVAETVFEKKLRSHHG